MAGPEGRVGLVVARGGVEAEHWTGPAACCCGPQGSVGLGSSFFFFLFLFLFLFLFFSFPNLIQTKFEFKYGFEFKTHSNKSMHQHECNTKEIKPMINFNYLRNKIRLNAN